MLLDKISFFEGSTADNLNIISGNTLPTGSIGELFFKTGTDEGLYYHDGVRWLRIGLSSEGGGGGGSIPSGTDLPTGTTVGQLFIKTGTGANTYIFNGTSWLPMVVELTHEEVDGTLWTWGFNNYGQLGLGNIVSYDKKSSPVQVGSLTIWRQISAGNDSTASIKSDGTLWTWGYNWNGQLGDGTTFWKSTPIQIGALTNWKSVSVGNEHIMAIKTDGTMWGSGRNNYGQLGQWDPNFAVVGTYTDTSTFVQIGPPNGWKSVSCGNDFTMAIGVDNTLWAWGANWWGQFGNGANNETKGKPTWIGFDAFWKEVATGENNTIVLRTDGTIWTMGKNHYGELGMVGGTPDGNSSPVQVGSGTDWKSIAAGGNSVFAIKTNGSLWAWGRNDDGQLGDGTNVHKSSPVQIGTLMDWREVKTGGKITTAIKTDGTLWAWGFGDDGAIGNGSRDSKSSPTQVGSLTTWKNVSTGNRHTTAIKL